MITQLAADTAMGAVTLNVADLDAMTAYYRGGVGLDVLSADGPRVTLGRRGTPGSGQTGDHDVVILVQTPELHHASPSDAGLFHTAILFDSEPALAAAVYSAARALPGSFTGSSDHLVSKAFYFNDPEGNGVELYWDRDRSQWSWTHGQIEMSTLFLDPNTYLQQHLTEQGAGWGDARVGHVHLSVGDVATAREFYVDRLGWEATLEIPGNAVFVSAGQYHHHMAMNVWNSRGAGRRQATLGLGQVEIVVPSADELGAIGERMTHYGIPTRDDGVSLSVDDPWGNVIRVGAAAESA